MLCAQWDGVGQHGLCSPCRLRFAAQRNACCPRCALHTPGLTGVACGRCQRAPPPFQRCIAAVDYGFPWDRLVARFKFQQQAELAGLLAGVLQDALWRAGPAPVDAVVPVPLSDARLAERGYNQAWELARRLATHQGLPAHADWLLRLRDTPHQVGLRRQDRERNLRDALWVPPAAAAALAGRHLALVDDVMTTGSTASAASQALLAAGAASVQVWVLARTPEPSV